MRPSLISLFALAIAAGPALAQSDTTAPAAPPAAAPAPTTAPVNPPSAAPAPTTAPETPAAPSAAPSPTSGQPVNPPTGAAPSPTPAPAPEAAPAPAAPPGPPTDPTAIALLSTLEQVCGPAVDGGSLDKLAKANGYRKSGDNYVRKGVGYQFTILAPGSNPTTCHVDIVAPVDPEAPAKPLVVALHNWATYGHGYSLYRNDKNTQTGQEITTRSWELTENGKAKALVITTYRKPNGAPAMGNRETSTMLYSSNPAPAATPAPAT